MANDRHLRIIEEGVSSWNRWRSDHRDIRPDLSGAEFVGKQLIGANLSGADLHEANFHEANLREANLSAANLRRTHLGKAHLSGADLRRADLRNAYLFGADLRGTNLRGANLREAALSGADLFGADLSEADLSLTDLRGTHLRGANFSGTNLRGANLRGANLSGAELGEAELGRAELGGAELDGAELGEAYRGAILEIPLKDEIPAGELGQLLHGLAELYSVIGELRGGGGRSLKPEELMAKRISVGTPNVAELIGLVHPMAAVIAALLAVLTVPKALGEGAKAIAAARKIWFEGTLLKLQLQMQSTDPLGAHVKPENQHRRRIAASFKFLGKAKNVVSDEPRLKIEDSSESQQSEDSASQSGPMIA